MKPSSALGMIVAAVFLMVASPAFAEILGQTQSDAEGTGKIQFEVDPSADPEYVAKQITDNVRITESGELIGVRVENGVATLEFAKSNPDVLVEALIDDEIAALFDPTGGAGAGGLGKGALAAGGAVAAGGIGYGIYTAVDEDDDDDQQTGTPAQ